MGNETDDPGPYWHTIAGRYYRLFTNRGKTFDADRDRTVGVSGDVSQPAGVRSFGMVLRGVAVFCAQPHICLFVC